jgi:hypothetical protein
LTGIVFDAAVTFLYSNVWLPLLLFIATVLYPAQVVDTLSCEEREFVEDILVVHVGPFPISGKVFLRDTRFSILVSSNSFFGSTGKEVFLFAQSAKDIVIRCSGGGNFFPVSFITVLPRLFDLSAVDRLLLFFILFLYPLTLLGLLLQVLRLDFIGSYELPATTTVGSVFDFTS